MHYGIRVILISLLIFFSNLPISSAAMAAEINIFDAAREGDVPSIAEYVRQGGGFERP